MAETDPHHAPAPTGTAPACAIPRGRMALLFMVMLVTAAGNTAIQSLLPATGARLGVPDIIVCYKGCFLGLEAKLPGGRLTELQKRAIDRINRAGGIARRVESVEDVKAAIEQADEEQRRA